MYVDPFWFGVLITIIVEIVGLFGFALIVTSRRGKK